MSRGRTPSGLPRNVRLLGWTSFFTDVGSEMILPVLPLFLKGVLGASMAAIGMIEGVAEATANLVRIVSGSLADRWGRSKPFIYLGYGLSTLVKPVLALAPTWHFVLGVRFTDRVGKGLRSAPRDAVVAASTPRAHYGRAFGYHRMMDTSGALIGSAIAAAVLWWLGDAGATGIRWLFAASLVPCLAAMAFIVPVAEPRRPAMRPGGAPRRGALSFPAAAWILLVGIALWETGNISYAFILLRLGEVGVPARFVPLVYLAFNVVYLLAAMPIGIAADRLGIRRALVVAPVAGAAAFWAMGDASAALVIPGAIVLYAVHAAAINTLTRAGVAHFAHAAGRGTLFGLVGACALFGNGLAGWLWDAHGGAVALRAAGALSLLALVPFSLLPSRARS